MLNIEAAGKFDDKLGPKGRPRVIVRQSSDQMDHESSQVLDDSLVESDNDFTMKHADRASP